MEGGFSLTPLDMQKMQTMEELRECNDLTVKYGLQLSEQQIRELTEKRFAALKDTGRIEFGQGILKKLVTEFCDSPYILQDNYVDTLLELQDAFYYFKNESLDLFTDDELITMMKNYFDGACQGSTDYLSGTSLEDLCRDARYGDRPEDAGPYGRSFR
jgi:hypothetical protein